MAKIHVLERSLEPGGTNPNEVGSVRCLYHVNISAQKNTAVPAATAAEPIVVAPADQSARVKGGTLRIAKSVVPGVLGSSHPDFPLATEETSLANQDLAEVELTIQVKRGDTAASVASFLDSIFNSVQTKAQELYTQRFQFYGTTRNPA